MGDHYCLKKANASNLLTAGQQIGYFIVGLQLNINTDTL